MLEIDGEVPEVFSLLPGDRGGFLRFGGVPFPVGFDVNLNLDVDAFRKKIWGARTKLKRALLSIIEPCFSIEPRYVRERSTVAAIALTILVPARDSSGKSRVHAHASHGRKLVVFLKFQPTLSALAMPVSSYVLVYHIFVFKVFLQRQSRGRSSSASRSTPAAAAPSQSRGAHTAAVPAGYSQPHSPAPPSAAANASHAQPKQPGFLAQMAATAGSVAVGSTIGHGLSHALFGGSNETAPAQAAAPIENQQANMSCEVQAKGKLLLPDTRKGFILAQ